MLDIAIDAAKQAGALALKYFKSQPRVTYKPDKSPVTKADIETEKLIRKIISRKYPDHGIIGEELPPKNPKAKYKWVIDPIDGTKMFVRQIPLWSTLLALLENDKPIIGIIYLPAIENLYHAQKGKGAFLNGHKIHVSKVTDINYCFLSHGSIKRFIEINRVNDLLDLVKKAHAIRGFSDADAYSYVASGKIDIHISGGEKIHDIAAPAILIEEAGGKFTDFNGKSSLTSGNAVATNGILHSQVLKILNS